MYYPRFYTKRRVVNFLTSDAFKRSPWQSFLSWSQLSTEPLNVKIGQELRKKVSKQSKHTVDNLAEFPTKFRDGGLWPWILPLLHRLSVDINSLIWLPFIVKFILLEVLLKPGDPYCGHFVSVCQSVSQWLLLCLHVEDLTHQKQTHANKHESWDTPKENRRNPQ